LTVEQFRARFPIFAHTIYVNSCSQGALSLDVRAALDAFTASWDTHGSPWERWVGEVDRLRAAFAVSIGAATDEIAVMPSASAAIAAIATALSFDGERRQVLLSEFEFPTMAHVWLAQQRRGAIVDRVPADGETLPIAHYQTRIDEQTLIVPAAHVCFRNGYRLDVVALASLCTKRGAYLMLDDYQRTGTAPLDVHALGVDFLVTGALKYLLGPAGIAFLYVRRELIERFEPLSTGWFGRVNPFAFSLAPLDWAASARRFETGTPPVPNVYAAAAGLDLLNALGPAAIDAQIRRLTARMVDGARHRGLAVATPDDPERRGALVVVRCTDATALVQRIEARGIVASARGTGLRVSFHAYNNDADVDAVLAALDADAALVSRAD
jgi:selenocysteine lyase/cysteine desulfurase